jgi:hypothetical protein
MADGPVGFDPLRALAALDRHRVAFVVVGGLARIVHGADEVTDTLDIVPSLRAGNLERLEAALAELDADAIEGRVTAAGPGEAMTVATSAGTLTITAMPAATRGYDDLRRAASREPLGGGLRARWQRSATSSACSPPTSAPATTSDYGRSAVWPSSTVRPAAASPAEPVPASRRRSASPRPPCSALETVVPWRR